MHLLRLTTTYCEIVKTGPEHCPARTLLYYVSCVYFQFEIGEKVIIMDNIEEVKRLQDGFGGWADHMSKVGQLSASECSAVGHST